MNDKNSKDDYQKTQAASSPGNLGEQANRNKEKLDNENSAQKTSLKQGLNEENSKGDAGAFEGFENAEK